MLSRRSGWKIIFRIFLLALESALTLRGGWWVHRSVVSNARAICKEQTDSLKHHATFLRYMQTILMFSHLEVVLVLDGARWPLKSATHTIRRNKRGAALEKAVAADNMNDSVTADKYYKQAVHIPDEFVSLFPGSSFETGTPN